MDYAAREIREQDRRRAIVLSLIAHEGTLAIVSIGEIEEVLKILLFLHERAGRDSEGIEIYNFMGNSNEMGDLSMTFIDAANAGALVSKISGRQYVVLPDMERYAAHRISKLSADERSFLSRAVPEAHRLYLNFEDAYDAIESLRREKVDASAT
jgi:hypothetical protein